MLVFPSLSVALTNKVTEPSVESVCDIVHDCPPAVNTPGAASAPSGITVISTYLLSSSASPVVAE